MSFEDFGRKVNDVISELKQVKPREMILIHHEDADGLCSGGAL